MSRLRTELAFPIRGIREDLPPGERVLWQGAPDWRDLAVTAFHVRQVAVYFALLLAWRVAVLVGDGGGALAVLRGALPLLGVAALGLGLLMALTLWSAKSTIYAITTQRVVMRVGMALPIVINLPFTGIASARLAQRKGGCGDLPLELQGNVRLAYVHLWPYVRPWRLAHTEPMLRAVPNAAAVATLLAQALAAASTGAARVTAPADEASVSPAMGLAAGRSAAPSAMAS